MIIVNVTIKQKESENLPNILKQKNLDMTQGPIAKPLISFTIPLVLGNVLQLAYNAADSIIVGKFVGKSALAAVGTSTPLMNFAILFISGMCMGASILISAQYGAKDCQKMERQISTTCISGAVFSILFSGLVILLTKPLFHVLRVPQAIFGEATVFLHIIFLGLIFTFIYNFLANTMRALGDSMTPLYFLMASSVINIIGDLIFVVLFKWGVTGSAVSTVLSEALCCLFCMIYIKKRVPLLDLGRRWLIFDVSMLGQTFSYGITSALQQMALQLGKIIIQVIVNSQGVSMIAAFTAVSRVDDFAFTPQQNIGHAMTTFIAQNRGAGHDERIKKGVSTGMIFEQCYSICVFLITFFGASRIMWLFSEKGANNIIAMGTSYLKLAAIFYLLSAVTNGVQGFFRGMGDLKITLLSTAVNMIGRVAAVALFVHVWHIGFSGLAWANMAGWVLMLMAEMPLLVRSLRRFGKREAGRGAVLHR